MSVGVHERGVRAEYQQEIFGVSKVSAEWEQEVLDMSG